MRPTTTTQVVHLFMLGALGIVVLAYTVLYVITNNLLEQQYVREVTDDLNSAHTIYDQGGVEALTRYIEQQLAGSSTRHDVYLLRARNGKILAGNLNDWPLHVTPDGQWRHVKILRWPQVNPVTIGIRAVRLSDQYWLLVGRDLKAGNLLRKRLMEALTAALVISVLTSFLVSYALSRLLLRRVNSITITIDEIMRGDLSRRVPVAGGDADEFDDLARSLNHMLNRLSELMATMRNISDSVAHDSRNTLTRMRARLARLYENDQTDSRSREVIAAILNEIDALLGSLSMLLQIARAEAGVGREQMSQFDLSTLVRDIGDLYQPAAEDQGVYLVVDATQTLRVNGHRQLLAQAIVNLVENAIKYSPPGGTVSVRTLLGRDGPVVSVGDQGPGIRAHERERAMERFVQLENDHTMTGEGLGLSLVASIARLHDARLVLSDNDPGLHAAIRFAR